MFQFPCQTRFRQMLKFNINFVSDILAVQMLCQSWFGSLATWFVSFDTTKI